MNLQITSFKKFIYTLWTKFLTVFGNTKLMKFPMFLIYDPYEYRITGSDVLNVMEVIQPGDVILRGYTGNKFTYLDSLFIPGRFSHGALYIGDNTIIHAVAKGVSKINIIDFLRCDDVVVLRPVSKSKRLKTQAIKKAKEFAKSEIGYDFGFKRGVSSLYCFELVAECYNTLKIKKFPVSTLFGLIKKRDPVYIAKSFLTSKEFKTVFIR